MRYLARTKGPADLAAIQREHVEGFIVHLLDNATDSTANNRYRGLQQFFKWALDEGEIQADPMTRMKPPVITEKAIPILSDDTPKKLLQACAGREFTELRDTAIVRVLIDTGMRREEVASIPLDDLDLDTDSVTVTSKGRRPATLDLSAKTCQALERYLRSGRTIRWPAGPSCGWARRPRPAHRRRDPADAGPPLRQAGIPHIHPHQFSHTAADYAMKSGMSDNDVMRTSAGSPGRCWPATQQPTLTSEPAKRTGGSAQEIGYRKRIRPPERSASGGLSVRDRRSSAR